MKTRFISIFAAVSFLSATALAGGQKVSLAVREDGFVPSSVTVKKGEPVTLQITRKTDKTCATNIVIDKADVKSGEAIEKDLPLNKPVEFTFAPTKSGELRYGCGMNKMVGGVLKVQ